MPPRWQTLLTRAAGLAAREAADTWLRYREEEARALREAWEAEREAARAAIREAISAPPPREPPRALPHDSPRAARTWAGMHWPEPPGASRARRKRGARAPKAAPPPPAPPRAPSPYAVLGVPEGTPIEACEAMFKALSLVHHPDRGGDGAKLALVTGAITEIRKAHGRGRAKD